MLAIVILLLKFGIGLLIVTGIILVGFKEALKALLEGDFKEAASMFFTSLSLIFIPLIIFGAFYGIDYYIVNHETREMEKKLELCLKENELLRESYEREEQDYICHKNFDPEFDLYDWDERFEDESWVDWMEKKGY